MCTHEYYPAGSGIANVAYYLVKSLEKLGHKCTVCSPQGPDIFLGNENIIRKYGRFGMLSYWLQTKTIDAKGFDFIWLHEPMHISNFNCIKIMITMHVTSIGRLNRTYPLYLWPYYRAFYMLQKRFLRNLKNNYIVTAISGHVIDELRELGLACENIYYVPNGVDVNKFKPDRPNRINNRNFFGLPLNSKILLFVGRQTYVKRPEKLIDTFKNISERCKDVSLVMAGSGELDKSLKKRVEAKNIENVYFLGHVDHDNLNKLYSCCDYYLMASEYEGFPLTLLEAMACGLPCLVENIPSLRIVSDAGAGLVMSYSNVEEASGRIMEYLSVDNREHSKNARNYVLNNFSWDAVAQRYIELVGNMDIKGDKYEYFSFKKWLLGNR